VVAVVAAFAITGPRIATSSTGSSAAVDYPARGFDPATRLVSTGGTREELWSSALHAFGSNPLLGIGPGTFDLWWSQHTSSRIVTRDAHSLYLETLAELGVPGFLMLLAFLGFALSAGLRGVRSAVRPAQIAAGTTMVAAFLVFAAQAGIDWMWESTAVAVLGLAAITIAGAGSGDIRSAQQARTWLRLAMAFVALIAGALQIPGIVASDRVAASSQAMRHGFDRSAVALAGQGVEAEPWAASPYAMRSAAELSERRFGAARADARRAIAREPSDWQHRALLARVELAAGHEAAARRALSAVERLGPALAPSVAALERKLGTHGH
jgi:hypothetical protein